MSPTDRLHAAAIRLATIIDIDDRMKDPTYVCDRSARAQRLRDEHRRAALAEYREASEALLETVAA